MASLIDNPKSQFHSWQWQGFFLMFFWVFTQWNDQLHQAITLKVIWTKPKCLKTKTSPSSTAQSMDCRVFLPLEKSRAYIMMKLWMRQISCYIVGFPERLMLLEQQGQMVKILLIYTLSKYWGLLTLPQGPEDHDPQDQCCGNKKPCKKV